MIDNQTPQLSDRELLIRIDTKLDGVIEDKKDHEARLRHIEEQSQRYVTTKQLWAGLTAVFAAAGSAFPIIQWMFNR
jgi:hypothetical protein